MTQFDEYKKTRRRPTNELEHDDTSSPETKRVLLYGWDKSSLSKVKIAVDTSGKLKVAV